MRGWRDDGLQRPGAGRPILPARVGGGPDRRPAPRRCYKDRGVAWPAERKPHMSEISQTFYVSRSLCSPMQVENIVAGSRVRNARAALTGAMVFTGSHFAQVLEGPPDAVDDLVARILRDERHEAMRVLLDRSIRARAFAAWTMDFEALLGADSLVAPLVAGHGADAARVELLLSTLFPKSAEAPANNVA